MLAPSDAASAFRCQTKFVRSFERPDPFNQQNLVRGYINRKKGLTGGSIMITHVNEIEVEPQLIYGTPKLAYPYKPNSTDYIELDAPSYYLADKWNGVNILFFKYKNSAGQAFVSAKTKGAPFVANLEFGKFFDLTDECFADVGTHDRIIKMLDRPGVASVSFELCGRREPHLVKYSFDIDLRPLFTIGKDGEIRPVVDDKSKIIKASKPGEIVAACQEAQKLCFEVNEQWRRDNGMTLRYEHDHFLVEGKVLYLLDENGVVPERTLLKIKSRDTESVHWARFDAEMEQRVNEVAKKIMSSEDEITEETLREELDMGPKEWSKFRRPILKFLAIGEVSDTDPVEEVNG